MIEKLMWDSDFFGYLVGRINTSETFFKISTDELNNFRLIYLFSDKVLEITDSKILEVDIKTTLVKLIEKNELYPVHESISEYSGGQDTKMKSLALESGKYSRFKTDKNFMNNEFIKLYSKWIEDSITKVIADKLIVFSENNYYCNKRTISRCCFACRQPTLP
jgi:dTDP-4-amino-4,6-dideoxy-D-galactose acyltransferase